MLDKVFYYDKDNGKLRWKIDVGFKIKAGDLAGYVGKAGHGGEYMRTRYRGKQYFVHRVIYELFYGKIDSGVVIDHINGNTLDNRIENLRAVDNSESMKNRSLYKKNKIGIAGVYKEQKRYRVRIRVNKNLITVGVTYDFFEACCMRKSAERAYGFHKNHCNR